MKRADVVDEQWSEARSGDGYWILLKAGFQVDDVHAIHEPSKTAAQKRLRDVKPCTCPDCQSPNSFEG